jgi:hypothetical protein
MARDDELQACKRSVKKMLRGYRDNLAEAERRLDVAQTANETLQVLSWLANLILARKMSKSQK